MVQAGHSFREGPACVALSLHGCGSVSVLLSPCYICHCVGPGESGLLQLHGVVYFVGKELLPRMFQRLWELPTFSHPV